MMKIFISFLLVYNVSYSLNVRENMRIYRGEHEKKRRNKGEGIFSENGKNFEEIVLAPSTYYLSMKNIIWGPG